MFGVSYWFLPLFSGCVWLGTLLAMLGTWAAQGKPAYPEYDRDGNKAQWIPYISDIGATSWGKPLFIAGSATAISVFTVTFLAERWLRHQGRLAKNYYVSEKILSIFASIFAFIGACGLIFLTIFDTLRYPNVHVAMLCVFIGGYIISAIFICAEYQRLGIHFREHKILAYSFWIKLAFIFVEIALAIAFGVTERQKYWNTSAVLEWTISLIFIFYMWSFIIDFLPAIHTRNKEDRFGAAHFRNKDDEMAMHTQANGNINGGPVYTNGGAPYGKPEDNYHAAQNGHVEPSRNF